MNLSDGLARRAGPVATTLLLAAAGAALAQVCVHTWAWWWPPLAIALLVAGLHRLGDDEWRAGAWAGWVFGTAWIGSAVWWLFISMHRYGGMPAALAVAAVALLAAALSIYLAVACAFYVRWRSGRVGRDAIFFTALWTLAEWARGVLFTGFPWAAAGYTQVDSPWAVLAPWIGVYGLGAWLAGLGAVLGAALAAAVARDVRVGWRRVAAPLSVTLVVALAVAALPTTDHTVPAGGGSAAERLSVTLLQPAVSQDEKFAESRIPHTLAWLDTALREARGALVVAPETAVPLLPAQLAVMAPNWWGALQGHLESRGRVALLGVPLGSHRDGYTNSAVAMGEGAGAGYRYDKVHLVPFGEFIPWGFRWFTRLMNIPLGDFDRGPLEAPSLVLSGQRIAPNICYEDLFGEELARRFRDPQRAPTVLANMSNIAWFGATVAVPQHLGISRMRSLELQRPMLRATNTGATAVIDHRGRVVAALPAFERGILEATVEGRQGLTPYARWAGYLGLWPLFALALGIVVAMVWRAPSMSQTRSP
jgi:apolipoprotein N-acyltransferase